MKKFILILITIAFAYYISWYTVGKEKGYQLAKLDFNTNFFNEIFKDRKPEKIQIAYKEAINSYMNGDYANTQLQCYKLLDLKAKYDTAYYLLGMSFYHEKSWYDAILNLGFALGYNENLDSALLCRGIAFYKNEQYDESVQDLYQYQQKNPNEPLAYYYLALNYEQQNNPTAAMEMLNQALKLKPDFYDALFDRGRLYINNEQSDKAIADYKKVILINNSDYVALSNLGIAYSRVNKLDSAIINFNKSIKINPDYYYAHYQKGYTLSKNKNFDEAIDSYTRCLELKDSYIWALIQRCEAFTEVGKYSKAIDDGSLAVIAEPTNHYALFNLAKAYDANKEYPKAVENYLIFLNHAPQDDPDRDFATKRTEELRKLY